MENTITPTVDKEEAAMEAAWQRRLYIQHSLATKEKAAAIKKLDTEINKLEEGMETKRKEISELLEKINSGNTEYTNDLDAANKDLRSYDLELAGLIGRKETIEAKFEVENSKETLQTQLDSLDNPNLEISLSKKYKIAFFIFMADKTNISAQKYLCTLRKKAKRWIRSKYDIWENKLSEEEKKISDGAICNTIGGKKIKSKKSKKHKKSEKHKKSKKRKISKKH